MTTRKNGERKMFNITDTEKLRDAYIFLTFAQNAPRRCT